MAREPETRLEQEERHVTALERIILKQEGLIQALDALGDAEGVAQARRLLASFQQSLSLAREHRNRLLER